MKISNIRFGHATNSSSYHSLVFLPPGDFPQDSSYEDGMFGWDYFTLASTEAKDAYMTVMLQTNLHKFDPQIVKYVIKGLMPQSTFFPNGYIDHQSMLTLPTKFGSDYIDEDFFLDLRDYILHPRVIILGGNDNEPKRHPLAINNFRLPITDLYGNFTCRKDNLNDEWILFNRDNGTRIRFSFNRGNDFTTTTTKAEAPELIDIKITDFCPYNCRYCYQNSTPTGKTGPKLNMYNLVDACQRLKVFEVAIGGGEPTLSKNFEDIIHLFYRSGITPNFSTRNLEFFRDFRNYKTLSKVGGVAFSVDSYRVSEKLEKLNGSLSYHSYPKDKISVQVIVGSAGIKDTYVMEYLMKSMSTYGFRKLTLLGSKPVGRAATLPKMENEVKLFDSVIEYAKKYYVKVGVDTQFIKMFQDEVEANIPDILYHEEEGKFSCYIDAVEGKIGASSYCGSLIDLPDRVTSNIILEHFSLF